MSPVEAKVFLAEDDDSYAGALTKILELDGHQIILRVSSLQAALEAILGMNEDEVDVALVDGNLSEDSLGGDDGQRIAEEFRSKFPDKPLLAISGDEQSWSDDPTITKRSGAGVISDKVSEL